MPFEQMGSGLASRIVWVKPRHLPFGKWKRRLRGIRTKTFLVDSFRVEILYTKDSIQGIRFRGTLPLKEYLQERLAFFLDKGIKELEAKSSTLPFIYIRLMNCTFTLFVPIGTVGNLMRYYLEGEAEQVLVNVMA